MNPHTHTHTHTLTKEVRVTAGEEFTDGVTDGFAGRVQVRLFQLLPHLHVVSYSVTRILEATRVLLALQLVLDEVKVLQTPLEAQRVLFEALKDTSKDMNNIFFQLCCGN